MSTIIKKSLIENAGNGLFATKKYKKGDLICFYDCEERNINSIDDFVYSIINPFNKKLYIGYRDLMNENGTGQFINDYCMFNLNDYDRNENGFYKLSSRMINDKIREYVHISKTHQNIEFKNNNTNLLNIYASKDINENDELYLHYGIEYWISKIQLTTDEPFTRLYCLLKNKTLYINSKKIYLDGNVISPEYAFNILQISPIGNIIKYFELEKYTNLIKLKKIFNILN
jgi:hypothetical protein